MTDVAKTAKYTPSGINRGRLFAIEVDLGASTLASSDTLTITLPDASLYNAIPVGIQAYTTSSNTHTIDADVPLRATTVDKSAGTCVLTATGNVAANTKVILLMHMVG